MIFLELFRNTNLAFHFSQQYLPMVRATDRQGSRLAAEVKILAYEANDRSLQSDADELLAWAENFSDRIEEEKDALAVVETRF